MKLVVGTGSHSEWRTGGDGSVDGNLKIVDGSRSNGDGTLCTRFGIPGNGNTSFSRGFQGHTIGKSMDTVVSQCEGIIGRKNRRIDIVRRKDDRSRIVGLQVGPMVISSDNRSRGHACHHRICDPGYRKIVNVPRGDVGIEIVGLCQVVVERSTPRQGHRSSNVNVVGNSLACKGTCGCRGKLHVVPIIMYAYCCSREGRSGIVVVFLVLGNCTDNGQRCLADSEGSSCKCHIVVGCNPAGSSNGMCSESCQGTGMGREADARNDRGGIAIIEGSGYGVS